MVVVDIFSGIDVVIGVIIGFVVYVVLIVIFGGFKLVYVLVDCGCVVFVDIGLDLVYIDVLGFEVIDVVVCWLVFGFCDDKYI